MDEYLLGGRHKFLCFRFFIINENIEYIGNKWNLSNDIFDIIIKLAGDDNLLYKTINSSKFIKGKSEIIYYLNMELISLLLLLDQ